MNFFQQRARRFWEGMRSLSPDCRAATRLQSDALDQTLPWAKRIGLRIHLLLCQACRRYGRQLHFLRRTLRAQPEQATDATPHTLPPEAQARLKRALHRESQ